MRKEWGGWIKTRKWSEFEREAKSDPSQILANCIAELGRGFTDKADVRALKRILYFLAQAGFEPDELPTDETPAAVAPKTYEVGFMTSADGRGDSVFGYAIQKGERVRWLIAHVNESDGITQASDQETTLAEADKRVQDFLANGPDTMLAAVIPPAYALWRIARGTTKNTRHTPSAIAYWKATLRQAIEQAHPAAGFPTQETEVDERRGIILAWPPAYAWRLELGAATPVLQRLSEAQQIDPEAPADARLERTTRILSEMRAALITPAVLADHKMRLLDLAYLLDLLGQSGTGVVMSVIADIDARGPDSDYARSLLDKTTMLLADTLSPQSDPRRAPRMSRTTS